MKTNEDVTEFDYEQQDAILAEMQAAALVIFKGAGTAADCASAVTAFARAAKARESLNDILVQRRISEMHRAGR
jgi:hypothetical protein